MKRLVAIIAALTMFVCLLPQGLSAKADIEKNLLLGQSGSGNYVYSDGKFTCRISYFERITCSDRKTYAREQSYALTPAVGIVGENVQRAVMPLLNVRFRNFVFGNDNRRNGVNLRD